MNTDININSNNNKIIVNNVHLMLADDFDVEKFKKIYYRVRFCQMVQFNVIDIDGNFLIPLETNDANLANIIKYGKC